MIFKFRKHKILKLTPKAMGEIFVKPFNGSDFVQILRIEN